MKTTYDTLLQYALYLISRKRYTETELKKKLARKKLPVKIKKTDIYTVIERLKELQYLNDEEFVRDYVSTRQSINPRGVWMLKNELKFKGVNERTIQNEFAHIKIDELKAAQKVLERKKRRIERIPVQKKKEKIFSLLASRGFNIETIYKILEKC